MGCGARVGLGHPAGPLGLAGGQALVVHRDRHVHALGQPLGEAAGPAGLLALLPTHRERQADHDLLDLALSHEAGEGIESSPRVRLRHRFERRHHRLRGVADRAAAAGLARVQREDPHQESCFSISTRAAASASGSLSGSLPPAWASVGLPPPPPPAISAATRMTSPAFEPAFDNRGREVCDQMHAPVRGRA